MFRSFSGARKGLAGELTSLIGVENLRSSLFKSSGESFDTKRCIQGVGKLPGKDETAVPVNDGHQIHEALCHSAVSDIRAPYLIGVGNLKAPQKIRIDLVFRRRLAGSRLRSHSFKAKNSHEALYFLPIDLVSPAAKPCRHSAASVKGSSEILGIYEIHENKVLRAFPAGSARIIIAGTV